MSKAFHSHVVLFLLSFFYFVKRSLISQTVISRRGKKYKIWPHVNCHHFKKEQVIRKTNLLSAKEWPIVSQIWCSVVHTLWTCPCSTVRRKTLKMDRQNLQSDSQMFDFQLFCSHYNSGQIVHIYTSVNTQCNLVQAKQLERYPVNVIVGLAMPLI